MGKLLLTLFARFLTFRSKFDSSARNQLSRADTLPGNRRRLFVTLLAASNGKRIPAHIISRKKLKEFWAAHPDAKESLDSWYRAAKRAKWRNLAETRETFPHADPYGSCTIFNIGGNKRRLSTKIYYEDQTILLRFTLTYSDYDREKWKNDCHS